MKLHLVNVQVLLAVELLFTTNNITEEQPVRPQMSLHRVLPIRGVKTALVLTSPEPLLVRPSVVGEVDRTNQNFATLVTGVLLCIHVRVFQMLLVHILLVELLGAQVTRDG